MNLNAILWVVCHLICITTLIRSLAPYIAGVLNPFCEMEHSFSTDHHRSLQAPAQLETQTCYVLNIKNEKSPQMPSCYTVRIRNRKHVSYSNIPDTLDALSDFRLTSSLPWRSSYATLQSWVMSTSHLAGTSKLRPILIQGISKRAASCRHLSAMFWVLVDKLHVTGMTTLRSWFGVTSVPGSLLVV